MKRVVRCYECGKPMRRLYIRESEVAAVHKGLLGEWREYKQKYKGYAWLCEKCKILAFVSPPPKECRECPPHRDEYVLVPVKVWESVKRLALQGIKESIQSQHYGPESEQT